MYAGTCFIFQNKIRFEKSIYKENIHTCIILSLFIPF